MDDALDDHKDIKNMSSSIANPDEYEKMSSILKKDFSKRKDHENNFIVSLISKINFFKESLGNAKDFFSILHECTKFFVLENFDRGDIIFHNGDLSEKIYIILKGKVGILIPKEISVLNKEIEENERAKLLHLTHSNPVKHSLPRSSMFEIFSDSKKISSETTIDSNEKTPLSSSKRMQMMHNSLIPLNFIRKVRKNQIFKPSSPKFTNSNLDNHNFEQKTSTEFFINDQHRIRYYRENICLYKLIKVLIMGCYLGEKGVIFEKPRKYTTLAIENTTVISLDKDHVNSIFKVHVNRSHTKNVHLMQLLRTSSQFLTSKITPYFSNVFYVMNDKVFSEGEESDAIYILGEGEIRITKSSVNEQDNKGNLGHSSNSNQIPTQKITNPHTKKVNQEILILSPGSFFGDEPLFNITYRNFTATVATAEAMVYKLNVKANIFGFYQGFTQFIQDQE